MKQTWRWFGPHDTVSTSDIRQAGAQAVVSALHHLPNGSVWPVEQIRQRQTEIATMADVQPSGLTWDVVESLPVSEQIKQQTGQWREHIENYKTSLENLSACGIHVVCYNFMPLLDWTRTDLAYTLPDGARCMRFDLEDFAAFDIHILQREQARNDFPQAIAEEADKRYATMSDDARNRLAKNIVCGLPGAEEGFSLDTLKEHLQRYNDISEQRLQQHQFDFLSEIIPTAERCNVRLCCHPDDPPFPLLGLPRIMSSEAHYAKLMQAISSPANGITLCSGSLGVRSDVDLPGMMNRLGSSVHFIHLRNIYRESSGEKISFHESAHLEGVTDMVALIQAILDEEQRRRELQRSDASIPFRPDHGQDILSDLQTESQPGYPAVGRLKGLAELRGIITALSHQKNSYHVSTTT
ncbi:MAG: mannonate dehydratase [Granulosicoccus sp.]